MCIMLSLCAAQQSRQMDGAQRRPGLQQKACFGSGWTENIAGSMRESGLGVVPPLYPENFFNDLT